MKNESIIRQIHNRYDKEFKDQAIRMWMNIGRSAKFTVKDLGMSVSDLYKWGRDMKEIKQTEVERESKILATFKVENERLNKELSRVTEQREILKKAAGILSQTPPKR
jgi:transposase